MANFTYIENAHVFSKAPVQLNMEASSAVNKSVHTVQSNEIWGEVCPFITKETVKDLEKDTLFELDGYAPVKFNYKKPAIVLDAINNNGMKSNGYVAKVIINNKPITQFIADTDVTDATGKLASGYRAVLYDKTGGEVADSKYTINYSNGLIYFKEPIESTLDSHYTLSFFTYEGVKLDTAISDIKTDIIENANKHSELSEKVDNIEDDYKEADIEINNNISNLSSKVADNKEKLEIAEANIENLDDRLIVVEENILDLDENISKLNSVVSSNLSDHINNSEIHVSEEDREIWNKGGTAIQSISEGNYIDIDDDNTISVTNIANRIVTNSDTNDSKLATVGAVRSHLSDLETAIDDLDTAYKEADKELESKLYTDFSFDSFEEGNDNYGTAYGFIIDENIFGKIKNIKVKCADYQRNDNTYLKIIDENNNIIGCSETAIEHGANKILNFEFKNVTLERGKTYKAIFSSTDSRTVINPNSACVRVNHEGNANHTAPSLVTPILNSNFNIQLGGDGKPAYAIVGFDISVAVNDLALIIQNNQSNHINDRIKHIFPEDYSYGNLNYTNFPFRGVSTSYGYGFIWKPETSAHISNISISLKIENGIFIYNPGNLSESILNASGPVSMCIKITDSSNNKVIGTSRVINIPAGVKDYQTISIPFDTLVPCIKNKTYIVTYHSSESAEKPDIVLPINISFVEDNKPITTDYTIKKLIIDTNNNEYYTEGTINDKTLNSDNHTYMYDTYLEHLCVKVSATHYTHPELELIANTIGDIWDYLGSIRAYISQL